MAYWLVKSEPSIWSWDQQVAKGAKGEAWTGVRNFTARQNLVNMKKGDKAFFYHSNEGKDIVGIAEVIKEAYPDPSDKTGKFVCVDIKADKPMPKPVTMAAIKAEKKLAGTRAGLPRCDGRRPGTTPNPSSLVHRGSKHKISKTTPCKVASKDQAAAASTTSARSFSRFFWVR
jgi:predicted RNA-binding protein with PUA-like domain